MNNFNLPFSIESKNQDYVLAKQYEEKKEVYRLNIPATHKIDPPLIIHFRSGKEPVDFELQIILENSSQATIIEDWGPELHTKEVQFRSRITCEENSVLNHIVLNHTNTDVCLKIERETKVGQNAKCRLYDYHFGSLKMKSKILQETVGASSEIHTDVVTRTENKQDFSFSAEHRYNQKEGFGQIEMKGIAEDSAILNFNGMVTITKKGGGSSGYLNQEILNLSEKSTIHTIPGLKIDTNDVKAGHGSSIRNLNDEDLFYFSARGIPKETAKKLMITGFIGKELEKLKEISFAYETIKKLI
jgi:Fe-S cluster assembly scaffold protein SufB